MYKLLKYSTFLPVDKSDVHCQIPHFKTLIRRTGLGVRSAAVVLPCAPQSSLCVTLDMLCSPELCILTCKVCLPLGGREESQTRLGKIICILQWMERSQQTNFSHALYLSYSLFFKSKVIFDDSRYICQFWSLELTHFDKLTKYFYFP